MDLPSPVTCLLSVLPTVLGGGPSYELDPSLVSSQTASHHRYLSASPSDPSAYLFIASSDASLLVTRLEEASRAKDRVLDAELEPEFHVELDGQVRSRLRLAHKLYCYVVFEVEQRAPLTTTHRENESDATPAEKDDSEGAAARWKFLTLSDGQDGLDWKRSLGEAFEAIQSNNADRWNGSIDIPAAKGASVMTTMAEGEGTTPGAYGAANDFWAGYSSDEDDRQQASQAQAGRRTSVPNDEAEEDDSYWNSYGSAPPSVIGDNDRDDNDTAMLSSRRRSSTVKASQPVAVSVVSAMAGIEEQTKHDQHHHDGALTTSNTTAPTIPTTRHATANDTQGLETALAGLWSMFSSQATARGMTVEEARDAFVTSASTAARAAL